MERVLIVDPDEIHASELEQALGAMGYETAVSPDQKSALELIKKCWPDLVLVVPRSAAALSDTMASTRSTMRDLEWHPELLFLLRWAPRGPAERLLGDRWNVQVLYAR